jgi:hypothetical protein
LSRLSGIPPEPDNFRRIVIAHWFLAWTVIFRNTGAPCDQSRAAVTGPRLVRADAPTNEDEQVPVLIPQAPGEEITFSFLKATAPLGDPLGEPLAQAPAQVAAALVFPVTPLADPLAQAASPPFIVFTREVAHPLAPFLPLLEKIYEKIPQILPRADPVHQKIAQIATHIAISLVPSLR